MGPLNDRVTQRSRKKSFSVVGNDDDIAIPDTSIEQPENLRLIRRRLHVFEIQANNLLLSGDDAGLLKRSLTVIDSQQVYAGIGCTLPYDAAGIVAADQRDQGRVRAHRHDIGRGVCCAAEHSPRSAYFQDRHRRFRRNPTAVANDVLIEDGVSEHEYTPTFEL